MKLPVLALGNPLPGVPQPPCTAMCLLGGWGLLSIRGGAHSLTPQAGAASRASCLFILFMGPRAETSALCSTVSPARAPRADLAPRSRGLGPEGKPGGWASPPQLWGSPVCPLL